MFLTVISERHRKASRQQIKRYKERLIEKNVQMGHQERVRMWRGGGRCRSSMNEIEKQQMREVDRNQ